MRIQAFCPRSSVQRLALDGRIRPGFSVTLAAQAAPAGHYSCTVIATTEDDGLFAHRSASTSCRRRPTFRFAFIHRDRGGCRAALHIHRPQRRPPGIRFRFFCFQRHARNLRAVLAFLGRGTKPTFFADDGLQFVSVRIDARRRPTRLPASVKALCLSTTNPSPSRSASCRRLCCSTRKLTSVPGGIRLDVVATNLANATDLRLSSQPLARGPASVFAPLAARRSSPSSSTTPTPRCLCCKPTPTAARTATRRLDGGRFPPSPVTGLLTLASPSSPFRSPCCWRWRFCTSFTGAPRLHLTSLPVSYFDFSVIFPAFLFFSCCLSARFFFIDTGRIAHAFFPLIELFTTACV